MKYSVRTYSHVQDICGHLFAQLKNGSLAKLSFIDCYYSKAVMEVLRKLYLRGFISSFYLLDKRRVRIQLRYDYYGKSLYFDMKRISTPGRRMYFRANQLARFSKRRDFLVATSKGILWLEEVVASNIGGEVLVKF